MYVIIFAEVTEAVIFFFFSLKLVNNKYSNMLQFEFSTNSPSEAFKCFMKKGSIVVGDGIVFMSQPLHRISEVHWGSNQQNNSRIFLIDNKRYEILNLVELLSRYNSQSINEKYILSVVILGSLSNYYKQFLFLKLIRWPN